VRLAELTPESARTRQGQGQPESTSQLGITAVPLTPDLARQLGLRSGTQGMVVEAVDPSGPAADAGLERGDVILQVDRAAVRSGEELRRALQNAKGRPPLLLISRGGQTFYVSVPLQ
jgi:serine protease Do